MALTLYGTNMSPFVRKIRVVLGEKGLAYTLVPVNIFAPPDDFVAISPLKRIPVLRDDEVGPDATLPDSSVIAAYLERKWANPPLYPTESFAYARALWFEEFGDTELAVRLGFGILRAILANQAAGKPPDIETARKTLRETMPRNFDYLEKELQGRTYLVGDRFSIADIAVATHFVGLFHAGGRLDSARWPGLSAYIARIHGRPSFTALIAEEKVGLPPPVDFS